MYQDTSHTKPDTLIPTLTLTLNPNLPDMQASMPNMQANMPNMPNMPNMGYMGYMGN